MRLQLMVWVALVALGCSGTGSTSQADCEAIAKEIRDKAGTRATGICTSTVKADVDRFGSACASLKRCNDEVSGR